MEIREFEKEFGGWTVTGRYFGATFTMHGLYDEDGKRHAYSWKRGPVEALKKELEGDHETA
jgi:hypothetical protein